MREGSSDISSSRADFFIVPQNVEDIEKYIADTVEDDLDVNIFSEEAKVPDIDTVELNQNLRKDNDCSVNIRNNCQKYTTYRSNT